MTERYEIVEVSSLKDLPKYYLYASYFSDTVDEAVEAFRKYHGKEPTRVYKFAQQTKNKLIHLVYIPLKELPHDDSASASIQQ